MVKEGSLYKEELKEAIKQNKVKELQKLLEEEHVQAYVTSPEGKNKLFSRGKSPLMVAMEKGYVEIVEIFLDCILSHTSKSESRFLLEGVLSVASEKNQVAIVKKLLDSRVFGAFNSYQTARWVAAKNNALEVVSIFLSRKGILARMYEIADMIEAAIIGGHVQIVKLCLEKTEVKAALKKNDWHAVKKSLLLAAVNAGSVEILNLLLDVYEGRFDRLVLPRILLRAVEGGNLEIVNRILDFSDIGHQIIEAKLASLKKDLNRKDGFSVYTGELTKIMYVTSEVKVSMQAYEEIQSKMFWCDYKNSILATVENRDGDDTQEKNWSDLEKGDVSRAFQSLVKLVLGREQTRWYVYRTFVIELLREAANHEHEALFDCLMKRTEGYDVSLDYDASVLRAALRQVNLAIVNTLLSIKEVSESVWIFKGLLLSSVRISRDSLEDKVIEVLSRLLKFPEIWNDEMSVIWVLREAVSCGCLKIVRFLLKDRLPAQQQRMIQSGSMGVSTFDQAVAERQSGAVEFFSEVLRNCPSSFYDRFEFIGKESGPFEEERYRSRSRTLEKTIRLIGTGQEWRCGR